MKIIHTSDWHLGRSLGEKKRYEEFSRFLDWLYDLLVSEEVEVLLIAGDVFDNGTPPNQAQQLYYRFIARISSSCCRNVIVTAGNHDSPTFLEAPKELLKSLNVYVIGSVSGNPEDEIIVLRERDNSPAAVVCAVPFLRDKDIRTTTPGETIAEKNEKMITGIKSHYEEVCRTAKEKYGSGLPLIATGHLFTAGGKVEKDDGVRELYVGSLAHVSGSVFPGTIDYLALGHLHIPQKVAGSHTRRYSGSPIPIGFGEAKQIKKVIMLDTKEKPLTVKEIDIPSFQALERISGDLSEILERIEELKTEKKSIWLEVEYTGKETVPNLRDIIDEQVADSDLQYLKIRNRQMIDRFIKRAGEDETLDDLDEIEVFERCLQAHEVTEEEKTALLDCYKQILYKAKDETVNEVSL